MASILIIEDDERLEETYTYIFYQFGYEVEVERDGAAGLANAQANHYDIITLDMMMPGMGGMEFLEKYDQPNAHPDTKIIVFSNLQDEDTMRRAFKLGAYRYEIKALFSPRQMGDLVQSLAAPK